MNKPGSNPGRYLVFDIGCIECGEPSEVVGTFDSPEAAEAARVAAVDAQVKKWQGQHDFETYDLWTGAAVVDEQGGVPDEEGQLGIIGTSASVWIRSSPAIITSLLRGHLDVTVEAHVWGAHFHKITPLEAPILRSEHDPPSQLDNP
jgi:hypothetical protein